MPSSSFNQNVGTFKGEIWKNSLPGVLGGFINNTIPMQIGDNPLQMMVINGVVCK